LFSEARGLLVHRAAHAFGARCDLARILTA